MKKFLVLIILGVILSGCATYKFKKSTVSGSAGGYLACYDGKPVLEYTVGKDKSLPDLTLAKERFKRRRSTVEYYYTKMDQMESRLKEYFWDTPGMLLELVGNIFRWPFIAVADYKYNRDPKYKERADRLDQEKDELEKARVNSLKEKLTAYIVEDLNKEQPSAQKTVIVAPLAAKLEPAQESLLPTAVLPETSHPQVVANPPISKPAVESIPAPVVEAPKEIKPVVMEPVAVKAVVEPPVAVITANPLRGYSPLTVKFSGQKSYSKSGKIIAYDWSFGDGDISTKKNPENTYWSTTFGPRNFTATLSVRDDAGNTSVATTTIEVITR